MFNINYVVIVVIVDFVVLADLICAMEFDVKPLELGTSGTIPCGHVVNITEIRLVQWYKSRRIDAFENGDHSLVWWTERESGSLPNYYMENTTFSLVISMATLNDEGLYKCSVISGKTSSRYTYYTRTFMYALPRMDPKITLDTDLNVVNCTVEHVRPVIHPVLNLARSPDSIETSAVTNEDGTYTTSVSCTLPQTESILLVQCSFSYLHYQRVALSNFTDTTTDSLMKNKTTTVSPMGTSVTIAGYGCRQIIDNTAIIIAGIVISLLTVTSFVLLIMLMNVRRKLHRGTQNCNRAKECEEKMYQPTMGIVA